MKARIQKLFIKLFRLPSSPSAIMAKINLKSPLKVVEIGVSQGANAFDMLYHMDIEKIYLIDPYAYKEGPEGQGRIKGDLNVFKAEARKKLKRWEDKTIFIYEPLTRKVIHDKIPDWIDYVYIDGDHRTKAVVMDIVNSMLITRHGGIIGGHDIQYESVRKAVTWMFGSEYNVAARARAQGFDWWVYVNRSNKRRVLFE